MTPLQQVCISPSSFFIARLLWSSCDTAYRMLKFMVDIAPFFVDVIDVNCRDNKFYIQRLHYFLQIWKVFFELFPLFLEEVEGE